MQLFAKGSVALSWATIFLIPSWMFYKDRVAQKQKAEKPIFFFDQMEFSKSIVDDNPKYHIINDIQPGARNHLLCRLVPISTTHNILGEIDIINNKIVQISRSGDTLDNLLLSVYQYGYLLEGRDSLGRRIMTLGTFSEGEQLPLITKDIIGRSLVVENQERQILAAGIISRLTL